MMQQPEGNLVTTSADIAVAALNLAKWAIIVATLVWVLAYWTPRAAQWWERQGCEETVITKQGTAWESLVEHDRQKFPERWRERK